MNDLQNSSLEQLKTLDDVIYKNDINLELYNFLKENEADAQTIYLCLFFLFNNLDKLSNNAFSYLNEYFDCIHSICDLKFDISLNSYEDYRNLIIILAKNYRVIIAVLYLRLYSMEKLKKIDFDLKKEYGNSTLKIFAPLAHRLGIGKIKSKLEELALYFVDLDNFKNIVRKLESKKEKRDKEVGKTIQLIENNLDSNIEYKIKGRSKSIYSIYKKLVENKKDFEEIYDFYGIRVICQTKEECYTILGTIHEVFEPIPYRFKDYILLKKPNLYQSIHTSVMNEKGDIYEVQIRTEEMEMIAERGVAAHWLYKEKKYTKSSGDIEESLHLFREAIANNSDKILPVELEGTKTGNEDSNQYSNLFTSVVYTYTPLRKLIILPNGATVIDFAYRIHTKVAEHMINALVNGKIVPFSYILQNGDIINIQTKENVEAVSKEWLNLCITAHSKKKIKSYINKKQQSIVNDGEKEGKRLLEHHLRNDKLRYDIINDEKIKNSIVKKLSYKSIGKLYSDFFTGKITLMDINKLELIENIDHDLILLNKLNKPKTRSKVSHYDILIPGIDNIKIEFAKCCHPVYGDEIIGIIKNGKSIAVHRGDCKNLSGIKEITLEWTKDNKYKYTTKLILESVYNQKLINDVVSSLSKEKISIKSANYKVLDKISKIDLEIEVSNIDVLEHIINILKNIGENTTIKRK